VPPPHERLLLLLLLQGCRLSAAISWLRFNRLAKPWLPALLCSQTALAPWRPRAPLRGARAVPLRMERHALAGLLTPERH
jgi:hypothetical protein